ncbi:MAG: hypothetical protein B6D59_05425 [Campylobacteraceae bacterium 4484_4]|nr:MAG: hypothetical protein B6D59_05425 [Campylobacteraceae bacterium 4484_4]
MYKIVILFALLLSSLFAESGFIRPYKTKLISTQQKIGLADVDKSVKKGASGIVIRYFDDTHYAIIAKAIVKAIKGSRATLRFEKFDLLHQEALPDYNIKPQKGDTVILNYLYNRALAITPDKTSYQEITKRYPDIDWVHPDLFAMRLSTEFNAKPTIEDFQHTCRQNDFELLFFAIDGRGYFTDCNSFEILQEVAIKTSPKATLPFFSRLGTIKGRLGSLIGGGVKNYNTYYKKILGL